MSRSSASRNYAVGLQDISNALIASGYTSLDKQAKALGVHRSTAWTIVKTKHKLGRLSTKTTARILANPDTPASVRMVIKQYIAERLDPFIEWGLDRALKLHRIIENLRSIAQECKTLAVDHPDKELSEYLREISTIFTAIASVLEEYDQ